VCLPQGSQPNGCPGPNPAGCTTGSCPIGQECQRTDRCIPSSCTCDLNTGSWGCTSDCGGGVCVASVAVDAGATWTLAPDSGAGCPATIPDYGACTQEGLQCGYCVQPTCPFVAGVSCLEGKWRHWR